MKPIEPMNLGEDASVWLDVWDNIGSIHPPIHATIPVQDYINTALQSNPPIHFSCRGAIKATINQ